jgi:hypothetical protein
MEPGEAHAATMRLPILVTLLIASALGCVSAPNHFSTRSAASLEAPESTVNDRPRELGTPTAAPVTSPPPTTTETHHAH